MPEKLLKVFYGKGDTPQLTEFAKRAERGGYIVGNPCGISHRIYEQLYIPGDQIVIRIAGVC